MIRQFALAAALIAPVSVAAQDLPTAPYLPLDMAQTAARAALDACSAEGHAVSVAVVARSGVTSALLRADNADERLTAMGVEWGVVGAAQRAALAADLAG